MKCKKVNGNQQENKTILEKKMTIQKKNNRNRIPLYLKPGEKIPDAVKIALRKANDDNKKERNFEKYAKTIQDIFHLPDVDPRSEERLRFLGGFSEGEASTCVGSKKNSTSRFGVYFDPEFNVSQHVNGACHLYLYLLLFRTGRIRYKAGSHATLIFSIETRESLKTKVIPFYKKHVIPYASPAKKERFERWCRLLDLFDEGAHEDLKRFLYEVGPLWDSLRMQKGQSNESFRSLEDFQQYVLRYVANKTNP